MKTPFEIVEMMLEKDAFSHWLGIELVSIEKGKCILLVKPTEEMRNGFGILHGGISYSIADSALAFAANSHGKKCVSIETSISHVRPVLSDTVLHVVAEEVHRGKTIGIYSVTVRNDAQQPVALFKGTVHISSEDW
jgi:acyl-CoA thioesterase